MRGRSASEDHPSITPPYKNIGNYINMPQTWYSVVINNPTPDDEVDINSARSMGWTIEGQLEVGKNGTPHYQLAVRTNEPWKAVKGQFPRANIQEAVDPEALRKYVVKTETRALDLVPPPKTKCPRSKLTNLDFYDGLLCTASEMGISSSDLQSDSSMTLYDRVVLRMMEDASTPQYSMDLATRANRPDVRAIYRRYKQALINMYTPEEIVLPMITDKNADDNEVSGDEDASDESSQPPAAVEAEEEGSEGDGGPSTEASDSEGDSGYE
jgi:hypothetical protein